MTQIRNTKTGEVRAHVGNNSKGDFVVEHPKGGRLVLIWPKADCHIVPEFIKPTEADIAKAHEIAPELMRLKAEAEAADCKPVAPAAVEEGQAKVRRYPRRWRWSDPTVTHITEALRPDSECRNVWKDGRIESGWMYESDMEREAKDGYCVELFDHLPPEPAPQAAQADEFEATYRVERQYSNGCEVCPKIWRNNEWLATVSGAPYLGHKSVELANDIVSKLNGFAKLTDELAATKTTAAAIQHRLRHDKETAEAEAAAMRSCLETVDACIENYPEDGKKHGMRVLPEVLYDCLDDRYGNPGGKSVPGRSPSVKACLNGTAGRDILARLKQAESDRERYRAGLVVLQEQVAKLVAERDEWRAKVAGLEDGVAIRERVIENEKRRRGA